MSNDSVDVVILSRDAGPLSAEVVAGLDARTSVRVRVHRVVGTPRPTDPNRGETIARARNLGKNLGVSPWLMFLDDDVALTPGAIRRLLNGLRACPRHAGLAADYLGGSTHGEPAGPGGHVAMGATLFRRSALAAIRFRWEPGKCECQCCGDDLRKLGLALDYLPGERARHLARNAPRPRDSQRGSSTPPGRVLAAFDRGHLDRFRRRFLKTLRASGNLECVTAVGYGLYPSECRSLASLPGVDLVRLPSNGVMPPIRRLHDFQGILDRWPAETPVAYWDAGDVNFQGSLGPLWDLVHAHPDRLLAVREPLAHPGNTAVSRWTLSIRNPSARQRAFNLLTANPFLNSGFAAGTASTLLRYVREADRMLHAADLLGSTDWGDQTALNLYCHTDPTRWFEIPEAWNYCLLNRQAGEWRITPDGLIHAPGRPPIIAAHGHARSLRQFEILRDR